MEKKQGAFRTTIGGQALIEGILMRGPEKDAIVVRSPEGLVTKVTERKFIKDRYPILGIPILRGAVTFISSMITGVKALMFSADYFPDEEDAKPSKFDQWLEKHIPAEKLQPLVVAFSVILSLGLTLLGVGFGLYGFLLGLIFFLLMLARQSSFGVGYLSHLPLGGTEGSQDSLTRPPLWSMKKYGRFLAWREGLRR